MLHRYDEIIRLSQVKRRARDSKPKERYILRLTTKLTDAISEYKLGPKEDKIICYTDDTIISIEGRSIERINPFNLGVEITSDKTSQRK